MTPKSFPHCRMKSSSRHTPNHKNRRRVGLCTNAAGEAGVLQRMIHGSVACVSPLTSFLISCLASSSGTGSVFGFDRRIRHAGSRAVSSWRRASCARLSRRPSREAALRSHPTSAHRGCLALGARGGANASPRLCRHQRKFLTERKRCTERKRRSEFDPDADRRRDGVELRFLECRRRSAALPRR